jgi:N-acetylglucosamine-6-sulfatase
MALLTDIRKEFLFAAAAAILLVGVLTGTPAAMAAERPNFVVIQTDDQSPELLDSYYRGKSGIYRRTMPNTLREIVRNGTEFQNYYATSPVCSPSRASLLTGQYPHTNDLLTNSGEFGGWQGWSSLPIQNENIPLELKKSGYRTAHFGKFMNSYFNLDSGKPTRAVPPGWSRWFTASFKSRDNRFYGYSVNDDGRVRGPLGDPRYKGNKGIDPAECELMTPRVRVLRKKPKVGCNYTTDVFTRKAVKEVERSKNKPFYLQIGYDAPHGDVRWPVGPQPATRHIGKASRTPLQMSPSFNEMDLSDKPGVIQVAAPRRLNATEKSKLKTAYRSQLESLIAVDEGVGAIVKALRRTGELDNTYIFFVSDHGFFLGEHRFSLAKFLPYEESSSVSMAVSGPDVPVGSSDEVVGNIDIPATISELADVTPEYDMDGRSMRPFWQDPSRRSARPVEISLLSPTGGGSSSEGAGVSARAPALRYQGYRVGPYKLVRYWTGESELYDLSRDPNELQNRFDDPDYAPVQQYMELYFQDVINCTAAECREELPPWPEPLSP